MKFPLTTLLVGGAGLGVSLPHIMSYRLADVVPVLHCTLAVAIPMRLVVVERIGPVPDPRIVAGSEALNRPAVIDLKLTQESHPLNAGPDVFVPFPNDRGNPFGPALIPVGPRPGCGNKKNIVMAKMDDVSRFFRNLLGLAPIKEFVPLARQAEHADHRMMAAHTRLDEDNNFHILPFMPGPVQGDGIPPPLPGSEAVSRPLFFPPVDQKRSPQSRLPCRPFTTPIYTDPVFFFFYLFLFANHRVPISDIGPRVTVQKFRRWQPNPPEFRHHRMWIHRHRPHSFIGRVRKAFLTLSPWEGRALSFVIGCGIGVLLR